MTRIDDEIRPLVGIRAVATIWVVLFHMHAILALLLPSAAQPVKLLCLVGTLLLTLVVGVAAYYAIEEPSRRALRRVGRRARVSATVPGAPG